MTSPQEDQISFAGIPADDVVDVLRSEPALAWFLAQGLWLSQPVLEIFWPQEKVAQAAEFLEFLVVRSANGNPKPAAGRETQVCKWKPTILGWRFSWRLSSRD